MTLLQTWLNYVGKTDTPAENATQDELAAQAGDTDSPSDPAPSPTAVVMYFASTSLDLRQTDRPNEYPHDIFIENVCYRKVDPEYLAWLRRRMEAAKRQFEAGKLPRAAWDKMRRRFNRLQEWAMTHYGAERLQAAVRDFQPTSYKPPVNRQPEPFLFPRTGEWRFCEPVPPAAVRKVDAIRETAKSVGWTDERLYQNRGRFRFPLGQDYGLVCFVGADCELGEITPSRIEIVHGGRGCSHSLWFTNADVFPPRFRNTENPS